MTIDAPAPIRWETRDALVSLALLVSTVALYWPVRHHGFVSYDDIIYAVENPQLRGPLDWARVWQAFSTPYESNWIPLTWLSLHLDVLLYGLEPAGHHLTNVALHALSSVVLYLALARLTAARAPSAFVAAVFAVHPLHVESVAWISERKDTLSGLFWMLSLYAYASYLQAGTRAARRVRYALVLAFFALGLLAKPMLVTLPFVLLLLDYWPARRLRDDRTLGWPEPAALGRAVFEKLPLIALAVAVSVVTLAVQRSSGAMSHGDWLPLPVRITSAFDAFRWYTLASFWPTDLAVFYPHELAVPGQWWIGAVMAAAGLGLALHFGRSQPQWLVGLLWFAITLVPVIGIVQAGMQARADRYMYLPLIGVAIAVAWTRLPRGLAIGAALAAIVSLCAITRVQLGYWKDSRALYERAIAVTEQNFLAENGLAVELIDAGEFEAAERHLREAVRIKPNWPDPQVTWGDLSATTGDPDAAISHYQTALGLAPNHPQAQANLAAVLIDMGRGEEAIGHLQRALREQRNIGFGHLHGLLGQALAQTGALEQAVSEYEQALAARPGWPEAEANLGFLMIRTNQPRRAYALLNDAKQHGGTTAEVELGLGRASTQLGRIDEAIAHYRSALELSPEWHPASNNLAWLLATGPDAGPADGREAVALANDSIAHGDRSAALLDTLAAAHATAGQFERAIEVAERAAEQAEADGDAELLREVQQRLDGYRAGRRYREAPADTGSR